ncbi:MAG TPA: J domain-containing protein [Polyangiaceae bacterium]|nr:J domain-containing protein [Polyangiaceae bacterium]
MTKPTATGNLTSTPFCELLVYALSQSLSGSLVLECPDRSKHAVLFQAGSPVKARVADPSLRLGDRLVASGAIDAGAQRAAEGGPDGELFGQRLIALGSLSARDLASALDEQLYDQIGWLARAPAATAFAYFAASDLLASWGGEHRTLDPLGVIWGAVQQNAPKERVAQAMSGLGDKVLRLHPASRIGRFGFDPRERPLLDVLRMKPQSLAELQSTGLSDPARIERLLYVLTLTRHLDTGELPLGVTTGTRPVVIAAIPTRRRASSAMMRAVVPPSAPPPAPEPPPEPPPQAAPRKELTQTGRFATREEIEEKHKAIDEQNHYEVLEIERNASPGQVAAAFGALARRWHPDRLSPELGDLKETAMRVFARITEAHRVISHPGSREEYDRSLDAGGSTDDAEQAQVVRVLRAAEAFQKAEILMRKRDLDGAERFASVALAGDKDQPEYAALHAWIRARKAGATEADIQQSLDVLKGAVNKQSNNVKIRYYHGGVLKLAGQENAALREFRFVAENDPSNLDAARELRLAEIRRQNPPEPAQPEGGGLFGRLFKR